MKATVLACLIMMLLWGCATFELEGDGSINDSERGEQTVHGTLYGFKWQEPSIKKCAQGRGIYRVEYYTNGLYVLASMLSVGFYVPQTVAWWCQSAGLQNDDDILQADDDWASEPGSP